MSKYLFTYNQEIGHQGQSLEPHFPGGLSGVTIGPGYDMGGRSAIEIYEDLTQAGVDENVARQFMNASHLKGDEAIDWVNSHQNLHISETQQLTLFEQVLVPEYEHNLINQLSNYATSHAEISPEMISWSNLTEAQKEMLFDFAYNPGLSQFPKLTEAVLKEDWQRVEEEYERFSGDEPLAYRNESFYTAFLDPNREINSETEHSQENTTHKVEILLNSSSDEDTSHEIWNENTVLHFSNPATEDNWFE